MRRLAPGERVDVTDGSGQTAQCVVIAARPGVLELTVQARLTEPEPLHRVVVVQAILKGDRGELAVELMTEVGVDEIVPWAAERCIARWRPDREDKALARWRSAAIEAAKQARRSRFPAVSAQSRTPEVADRLASASMALLLDPAAPDSLDGLLASSGGSQGPAPAGAMSAVPPGEIVLIIGPEGGISPAELTLLTAAGAAPARLGPSVLRGSTAGAVAAALVLSRCGRWA